MKLRKPADIMVGDKTLAYLLEQHKLWLADNETGAQLVLPPNTDLRWVDMRYADMRHAYMRYADMRYADMRHAYMRDADMRYANMRYADMRYANMRYANMRYADMRHANMRYADMRYADMHHAYMQHADIRGADIDMAAWPLCCGGCLVKTDRRQQLQLIYHAFNQECDDASLRALLEPLRAAAQEFKDKYRNDAPTLRSL